MEEATASPIAANKISMAASVAAVLSRVDVIPQLEETQRERRRRLCYV